MYRITNRSSGETLGYYHGDDNDMSADIRLIPVTADERILPCAALTNQGYYPIGSISPEYNKGSMDKVQTLYRHPRDESYALATNGEPIYEDRGPAGDEEIAIARKVLGCL
jgi:hypothetical protein